MHRKVNSLVMVAIVAGFLCISAIGQNAGTAPLGEQLKAQYTLIQACGADGTVLVVRKYGIVGVPQISPATLTAKYQNGVLHAPAASKIPSLPWPVPKVPQTNQNTQTFGLGLKVYPTRIDVNAGKDSITLGIVACDINYKANIAFQFDKGALHNVGAPEVVQTISQVLAFDQPPDPAPPAQDTQSQSQAAQPQDPPAEPAKIHLGQTVDEVKAAMGEPEKQIDLGAKQIFIYKSVKITFKDGKVSDAE